MPRLGLSYAAVKEAAERLEAQGLPPTVMRIRAEVGGTGSMSTIARHLKEWRQANGHPLSVSGVLAPSPFSNHAQEFSEGSDTVPAEVGQIARSAWQRLTDLASQEITEAQAACEADKQTAVEQANARIAAAEQQLRERQQEAAQQVELARAHQQQAQQQAEQERRERLEAQTVHRAQSEEAAAKQQKLAAECASAHARIEELQKRLSTSEIGRHKAEEARELAIERQRSSEAQCQARMDKAAHVEQQRLASATQSFERLISSLRQDEGKARAFAGKLQQEVATLKEKLAGQETLLQETRKQIKETTERLAREHQATKSAEKRYGDLLQRAQQLQKSMEERTDLKPSLGMLEQTIRSLEKRLS